MQKSAELGSDGTPLDCQPKAKRDRATSTSARHFIRSTAHSGAGSIKSSGEVHDGTLSFLSVRCRRAIIYVRQSTGAQVQDNQESQRLQYAMASTRASSAFWGCGDH